MRILRDNTLPVGTFSSMGGIFASGQSRDRAVTQGAWKQSKYNIRKLFDDGTAIIYNTGSDGIVGIDSDERGRILTDEGEFLDTLANDDMQLLARAGIIIPTWQDEDAMLDIVRDQAIYNTGDELKIAINPTLGCNARCEYCFEAGAQHGEMDDETVTKVADFVSRAVPAGGRITFRWFGGEPLMAYDKISRITQEVYDRVGDSISYKSTVLTNGVLIDDTIIDLMAGLWHTTEVHLTLDGTREEHNRIKHFLNKDVDGYQAVLDATEKLLDRGIAVVCRINVTTANEDRFEEVVSEFDRMRKPGLLRVYPAPTRPHTKKSLGFAIDYERYAEMHSHTMHVLRDHGFFPNLADYMPIRKVTCCSTRATNELVVDYDGQIYKCMQVATRHQNMIGDVETGLIMNEELAKWAHPTRYEECAGCVYFPICQGGCQGFRSLGSKDISVCVNERWYMDSLLELVHEDFIRMGGEEQ